MSLLGNIGNIVSSILPKVQSTLASIESNPVGKVGIDILKQLASSVFSKDGKGGVFSDKLQVTLPNPLAKLNKLLADVGQKFLSGGDFLKNIGGFLSGNRTLESGTEVNVPRLQDRAATSASATKSVAASVAAGNFDSAIASTKSASTASAPTASTGTKAASTASASTASTGTKATTGRTEDVLGGGSGSVLDQMGNAGGAFNWKSLTPTQSEMMKESGIDPNSPEGKRMVMQFKMQNYSEVMQLISNIAKQLSDISKSIIRNIS